MEERVSACIERRFPDTELQSQALAEAITQRLQRALAERGVAVLAVSGGKSPVRLFQLLSQAELDWQAVTVTLVDERWVAPEHEASNERLLREHLLVGKAASARFLPLKNSAATPEEGALDGQRMLAALPAPMDVVVLGMGDDGHTASLFPQAQGLAEALDTQRPALCAAVRPLTAPHPRMSLTLRALQASRWLVLPLQGESKIKTYRHALEPGPVEAMPVRAVLRQTQAPLEVWLAS